MTTIQVLQKRKKEKKRRPVTLCVSHVSVHESHMNESLICILRSLSVGIFISVDYWWTSNVTVRGLDEVSST